MYKKRLLPERAGSERCASRLHLCATQDIALPAGCKRPMLIMTGGFWYRSLGRQWNYQQQARQAARGELWRDLLRPPSRALLTVPSPELAELPAGTQSNYKGPSKRSWPSGGTPQPQQGFLHNSSPLEERGSNFWSKDEFGQKVAEMPKAQGKQEKFQRSNGSQRSLQPISSFCRFLQKKQTKQKHLKLVLWGKKNWER